MKNIMFKSLLLSSLLLVGCSETPAPTQVSMPQEDVVTTEYTKFVKLIPLSEVKKIIFQTAEEAGWKMTEFKENSILAEKIHDNVDATAVMVYVNKNGFKLEPANNDLQSLLEKRFN